VRHDARASPPVWIVEGGLALSWLGNGAVAPFLLIYLHNVRGLTLAAAGLAVAVGSAAALAVGLSAGCLVDRLGARPVLAGSLLVASAGFAALLLVRASGHAFVALAVSPVGHPVARGPEEDDGQGENDQEDRPSQRRPVVQVEVREGRVEDQRRRQHRVIAR
jgi:hypothetical protein